MSGTKAFLQKYCSVAEELLTAITEPSRVLPLGDGQFLCRADDLADCYWIIEEGDLCIEFGGHLLTRRRGETVGEQAFYRDQRRRGADIRAMGRAKARVIDRSVVDRLPEGLRSAWHETIARALSDKLDQATKQRALLHREQARLHEIVLRFVCEEGRAATFAALMDTGILRIPPSRENAIVWFSDISGFSSFARDQDPALVAQSLRRLQDAQAEAIESEGGQIDKFTGDGLMAFWICPDKERTHDHARSSIRAAITAAHQVASLATTLAIPIGTRIGLHYGPVVIGDFGASNRVAFTLLGETVNAAARFEQARDDENIKLGAVRVSKDLFAEVRDTQVSALFNDFPVRFQDKTGVNFEAFTMKIRETASALG